MSEQPGKFTSFELKQFILNKTGAQRAEVLTAAAQGVDTSVIDLGNGTALAVTSDPVTLIPGLGFDESALLSVHLTANDAATTGFAPQYAQFVLNLPIELSNADFEKYWRAIHAHCKEAGIAVTGGHTGRIPGQNSTVPGGVTMFLTAPKNEILTSNNARPGDILIMTKEAALSSTSILAKSFPKTLRNELGDELYEKAVNNFHNIPAQKEAIIASKHLKNNVELHAMHDVTEGGIIGASIEMAEASNCGVNINSDAVLAGDAQKKIADFFDLDYRKIIGSGSMLMAVTPNCVEKLISTLEQEGIQSAAIGTFTDELNRFTLTESGTTSSLTLATQDPYWAAFFNAFEKGMK